MWSIIAATSVVLGSIVAPLALASEKPVVAIVPVIVQRTVGPATVEPRTEQHRAPPELDTIALMGFLSLFMLLVCSVQMHSEPGFALGCAVAGAVAVLYGVLQGAWPLSIAEAVWAVTALRRWRAWKRKPRCRREAGSTGRRSYAAESSSAHDWRTEDRLIRLFGIK